MGGNLSLFNNDYPQKSLVFSRNCAKTSLNVDNFKNKIIVFYLKKPKKSVTMVTD